MMKTFECQMCGECCYGEGGILVGQDESNRIALFLGIDLDSFLSHYCEEKYGRHYIRTGPDGFCIFYHRKKHCLIHPVKPECCSAWPFYPAIVSDRDSWELAKEACPGISSSCSFEEIVRGANEAKKS